MILAGTARSLQGYITGTTATARATVSWCETDLRNGKQTYGNKEVDLAHEVAAAIMAAPSHERAVREVKHISIYNNDGTTTTVSVYMTGGDITTPVIAKAALGTLESLHYSPARGWYALTTAGAVKTTPHA